MKTMTRILAIVMILGILICLTACGGGDAISGKWSGENDDGTACTWEFKGGKCHWFEDLGEGYTMDQDGTYEIDEAAGTVVISLELWDEPIEYKYSVDDSSLVLTATNGYSPNYNLSK